MLEALGVKLELSPAAVGRCIEQAGIGFMFAPAFHPAMRHAGPVRREIGIRTVFNILGPLTNPAGASAQLIGVADPAVAETMAAVLGRLGSEHALVVHGRDGLDEISLGDATDVWELKEGQVSTSTVEPEDMGLERVRKDEMKVGDADESALKTRQVLDGAAGPARNVVLANAAGALLAADRVSSLEEGVSVAAESIDGGGARRSLDILVELSQGLE